MKRIFCAAAAAAAMCLTTAVAAQADGHSGGKITDQSYKAGKYSGSSTVMNNCPPEYREIYRGDLYCRNPEYQVIAPRSHLCPDHMTGMYRGNLYCVAGRG